MTAMTGAVAGALISGVAMYAVGTRAAQSDQLETPALVQTADGRYATVPAGALQPLAFTSSPAPAVSAPRTRTVYRTVDSPAATQTVYREDAQPKRSWKKTALVIGGSTGAGAGVGAIVGGKKGALIGAAVGGGAASIYEATRHR